MLSIYCLFIITTNSYVKKLELFLNPVEVNKQKNNMFFNGFIFKLKPVICIKQKKIFYIFFTILI